MVQKKKKKQSKGRGVIYFVVLLCIICLTFEPITKALHINLPGTVTETVAEKAPEKQGQAVKKTSGKQQSAGKTSSKQKPATKVPATKIPTGKDILRPAPLKKTSEQILYRKGYTVSYNKERKVPNWVAWELTPEKLVERESRTNKFLPDPDLPDNEAVTTHDYKGAGMDRGHMCPAGDNRWHWKAMQESFYMTNICPQNHNLNRGDWKELEEDCRKWAKKEGKIYIVCGPVFYKQKHRTIGKEHLITVPEAFFKVVLSMKGTPKAIGFIYKNASGNHPLDSYVNSVDEVERITGIDFFPALPDDIEKKVEAKYNLKLWR